MTGILGANCRHSFHPFVEGVSERTYTDEQLADIDPPPFEFEGRQYTAYGATQKQRDIERTVRQLKRRSIAQKAAGLREEQAATNARIRRLNAKYEAFSRKAGLPTQKERMKVMDGDELTDDKRFAPLKDYEGKIDVVGKFSDRQYQVKLEPPVITGVTQHYSENIVSKTDRAFLTVERAQSIINNHRLILYQTDRKTLKFLSDNGYVVLSLQGKLVTAVPEKLRKKYLDYLEGKKHGKRS